MTLFGAESVFLDTESIEPGAVFPDRIKAELARTTAFVLPSFSEGLPVVIMEAMAASWSSIACLKRVSKSLGARGAGRSDEGGGGASATVKASSTASGAGGASAAFASGKVQPPTKAIRPNARSPDQRP